MTPAPSTPDDRSTLNSIQYLRAVAALSVVIVHIGWANPLWGQQGVDVFFIISGFIMMHISGRESRPLAFLIARAKRIVPLYWVATLAWLILHPTINWDHVLLSMAFVPHIGPEGMIWPVIWQGFTLLYEAFFYFVFAATLLLPPGFRLPAVTMALGLLAVSGLILRSNRAFSQVYLSPLLLEFVAGAWLHRAWRRGWLMHPGAGFGALAAGVCAFVLFRYMDPGALRVIIWGVPSLLLVGGGLAMEPRLPRITSLLLLGDASYAIYLTHRFVIEELPTGTPNFAFAAVLWGCATVGVVVHLLVERPTAAILRHCDAASFVAAISFRGIPVASLTRQTISMLSITRQRL